MIEDAPGHVKFARGMPVGLGIARISLFFVLLFSIDGFSYFLAFGGSALNPELIPVSSLLIIPQNLLNRDFFRKKGGSHGERQRQGIHER